MNGLYQVSNTGKVKSIDRKVKYKNGTIHAHKGKILMPLLNPHGYYQVNFRNKTLRVHRLVARAFIQNPKNYPIVNHIDGDKKNNNINNLEWCTSKYNSKEAYRLGLTKITIDTIQKGAKVSKERLSIRINQYNLQGKFIKTWDSAHEVERSLKINNANIIQNCKHKRNTAGGFIWRYA